MKVSCSYICSPTEVGTQYKLNFFQKEEFCD